LLPFPQSENYINVNYRNVPEDTEVGGPTVPLRAISSIVLL